jgi:hypothetical protein
VRLLLERDLPEDDQRPGMVRCFLAGLARMRPRLVVLPGLQARHRQFAIGMGDDPLRVGAGMGSGVARQVDHPLPVVGALRDLQLLS